MASLKLQTNIPEVIALKFADGLPVTSDFGGDQVMFTLTDGRKWYISPFVADKVAAAGVQPNQPFQVCKREIKEGNRRTVEYQIEAAAAFSENATAAAIGSTYSSNLTTQSYNGNAARQLHVMNAPAAPPPPAPAPVASAQDSSAVALMKMAGCGAIDAVLEMESYARSKGMTDFVLGSENIQKIAVTLFLSMKGGR